MVKSPARGADRRAAPSLSPEDLARRRPVWAAMSDIFLDTEVRWSVPYIANCCAKSGYDDGTLERIFWIEVFPEATPNLLSIFSQWAGLDLDEAALIRRASASKMPWLRRRLNGWMVESSWRSVCAVTQWLRPLDDSLRLQFVKAFHICGLRYFEAANETISSISRGEIEGMQEIIGDVWQRYEPVCRSMLLKSEASTHETRSAAVRRFCINHLGSADV
ncbi:hypothetical protein SAMN05443245_6853 [Paraburkholderia fungorum]|uniref:DUF7079 domain-containing protein n=1 Tax=Paraburkholderia fungorum TaxID=134537 RepID=A0A1H1JME9_9BURK|nr:hypothetical protein SAMN05443245_6853 [Paraburkholderia fungorum]